MAARTGYFEAPHSPLWHQKKYCVDLGAQSVGAAVFSKGKQGQLILDSFTKADLLADPAADSTRLESTQSAIGDLRKSLKLKKGDPVCYAVSSQSVFTRFVALPPLDVDQLDQIVGFEAQQQIPFPIEDAVWDYQTLGNPDDIEVEVVLVAIKDADLEQIDNTIRSHGFETKTVDLAPMALYNAFRYNYPDLDQPVLLVDIGARTTNLIYIEGAKLFVRTVPFGGREVTQAISKEFGITFQEAEERKIQDGFVALGGGYADHDDPEIAAMSKVIRNASTRLHSEIVRTNNFYRSNQGGTLPAVSFLCGSGSGLPYLNEFLQEKLKLQVEYFNALRNVQLGKRVDEASLKPKAHAMGELIGLGLRGAGECPMEISLVPRIVQKERDIVKRAPYLWMAGIGAAMMMAASGFWFQRAASVTNEKASSLAADVKRLTSFQKDIEAEKDRLVLVEKRATPYGDAVLERVNWITAFQSLNAAMVSDLIWFVELQPIANGEPVIDQPRSNDIQGGGSGGFDSSDKNTVTVDAIRLRGLWRDTSPSGNKVVFDYLKKLIAVQEADELQPIFDIVKREGGEEEATGGSSNRPSSSSSNRRRPSSSSSKNAQPAEKKAVLGKALRNEKGELIPKQEDVKDIVRLNVAGSNKDQHAWEFTLELPLIESRKVKYSR